MDISGLQAALDYGQGEFDLADVERLAAEGRMQIWKMPTGSLLVTEIVTYPKKKRLRVVLMSGTFNEEVVTFFESFAKEMNLDGIEVIGRKGWVRALRSFGYKEASVNVLKDF